MRLRVTTNVPVGVSLPDHYDWYVQAYIYSTLSESLSSLLHDLGFSYGKRTFKLFTFSRLIGKVRISNGIMFIAPPRMHLLISSPLPEFTRDLANQILERGEVRIGEMSFGVRSTTFVEEPELEPPLKIRTLSPITVYSTLLKPDGKKKTYYYSPFEEEFSKLITENARKKYRVLTGWHTDGKLYLEPVRVREVIVKFKKNFVRAWEGTFILKGSRELIKTVYDTGLGAKNSEGFGMFEVVEEDRGSGG